MRPDAIYRCTVRCDYTTKENRVFVMNKDERFLKTTGPDYVYLNNHEQPEHQLAWLDHEEFEKIAAEYLEKESDV